MRDQYDREIDYIRISVTDRCNLRCRYCMPPAGVCRASHDEILRFEEILRLARLFADCGVRHVKLTGGEPLVRKGVSDLVHGLKAIPGIQRVTLTTNGLLLEEQLPRLTEAGLDGVNISLDTLDEQKYREITGGGSVARVLSALEASCACQGLRVKLNAVLLADWNLDEIPQLAALARDWPVDVRFIEMMPIGLGWKFTGGTGDAALERLQAVYGSLAAYQGQSRGSGPAVYYEIDGFCGKIGMISAMSHSFCGGCNRIRLTSRGFLKPCLHYDGGTDLRQLLRTGAEDERIKSAIKASILHKPGRHGFCEGETDETEKRNMWEIGG